MKHTALATGVDRDSANGRGVDGNRLIDFELFPTESHRAAGQFRSECDCVAVRRSINRFTQGDHIVRRVPFGRVFQCVYHPGNGLGWSGQHCRLLDSPSRHGQKDPLFKTFYSEFTGIHHRAPSARKKVSKEQTSKKPKLVPMENFGTI